MNIPRLNNSPAAWPVPSSLEQLGPNALRTVHSVQFLERIKRPSGDRR